MGGETSLHAPVSLDAQANIWAKDALENDPFETASHAVVQVVKTKQTHHRPANTPVQKHEHSSGIPKQQASKLQNKESQLKIDLKHNSTVTAHVHTENNSIGTVEDVQAAKELKRFMSKMTGNLTAVHVEPKDIKRAVDAAWKARAVAETQALLAKNLRAKVPK